MTFDLTLPAYFAGEHRCECSASAEGHALCRDMVSNFLVWSLCNQHRRSLSQLIIALIMASGSFLRSSVFALTDNGVQVLRCLVSHIGKSDIYFLPGYCSCYLLQLENLFFISLRGRFRVILRSDSISSSSLSPVVINLEYNSIIFSQYDYKQKSP